MIPKRKKHSPKILEKGAEKKKKKLPKRVDAPVVLGVSAIEKVNCVVRERVSCGCTPVDAIMGGPMTRTSEGLWVPVPSDGTLATQWGVPVGRIIEVVGGYSTGKSTFVENLAAEVQKVGGDVYMGIPEATIDPDRMARIGVDVSKVIYKEFEYIEDGFDWVCAVLEKSDPKKLLLVTWDSLGGSHPIDTRPGAGSVQVRQGLRRIINAIARSRTIMVFTNQTAVTFDQYDPEPATPFGAGVRFHASIRLEFKGIKYYTEVEAVHKGRDLYAESYAPAGTMPVCRSRKNKTFPPGRRCRMPLSFIGGMDDDFAAYLYLSQKPGIISTTEPGEKDLKNMGPVVTFGMEPRVACYWNTFKQFVHVDNPAVWDWMKTQCRVQAWNGYDPIRS